MKQRQKSAVCNLANISSLITGKDTTIKSDGQTQPRLIVHLFVHLFNFEQKKPPDESSGKRFINTQDNLTSRLSRL